MYQNNNKNNRSHKDKTMAKETKHVGKIVNTGEKVAVVFRTVPGESNMALVLPTATLRDDQHNSLMELIDSEQAQQSNELGEIMFTRSFPNGLNMLTAVQSEGRLKKVATDTVIMTPTPVNEIKLSDLNVLIAEQRNVSVDDLYTFVSGAPKDGERVAPVVPETTPSEEPIAAPSTNGVLSDSDLARSYRSQADAMYKEAARLRREADELDPPKKKTSSKIKEEIS
jgi:hypothetical protein